jgi:ATP-dependent Zn protease
MSDIWPSRKRLAVHEASHAVIARVLGVKVVSVTIGKCAESCCNITGKRSLKNDLLLRLAGQAAELEIFGDAVGGGADQLHFSDRLDSFAANERQQVEAWYLKRAAELVHQHREDIEILAEALMVERTMTAADITRLLGSPEPVSA